MSEHDKFYFEVKALLRSTKAYTILLGGRNLDKANTAAKEAQREYPQSGSVTKTIQIDVEEDDSISTTFEHVAKEYGRVDALINNAGAMLDPKFYSGNIAMREMWSKTWNVNTAGTHILTHTFVPILLESRTRDLSSSRVSPAKGWPKKEPGLGAYRSSKAEDGVKVFCVSSGFLATGLGVDQELNKRLGALDPTRYWGGICARCG
ncbi:hypothetical protein BDV29DRAFT_187151 [Aspergillus leporis]|uniref:NAD(P)-binding protein n=1 Tax=Aspergillus leporis TaxID=41062 RepID=A0A5N5XH33_9EURO|nr:hypothetical protein BDV29DRAFT_187151 [Aspergillus leporis]